MPNVLLCDNCFDGGEEKTCTHGVQGGKCGRCGRDAPYLHCLGSAPTFRPLRGRVAVREIKPKQVGRIHLPDTAYDNPSAKRPKGTGAEHRGIVLGMGEPALTPKGAPVPHDFEVGDLVLFVFAAQGCEDMRKGLWPGDGEPCVWLAQEEIIAVFTFHCVSCGCYLSRVGLCNVCDGTSPALRATVNP